MIPRALKPALYVQLLYAGLVIGWQVTGVALVASGRPSPGPTASLLVAVQAAVVAGLYVLALRHSPLLFVCLSGFSALAGGATIVNAFTADPALWSSDASRYLGVAVNSVGVIGLFVSVVAYRHWRRLAPA